MPLTSNLYLELTVLFAVLYSSVDACMTRFRLMGTYLSHPVTKNLTLHRMSKIEFQPDFRNPQMLSFLNMCNTMGSKMDGLAVREHFLSKNAEKTAF